MTNNGTGQQMGTQRAVEPTSALARVEARPIEPANMGELQSLASMAAKTGFFGAKSQEQALLVMMAGRDLGLSYSQALRAFHVIEGKPTLSADGMVAACLVRRDVCEWFRTITVDNAKATVETKRVGQDPQRYTFSTEDAQRAGLNGKQNWAKYPSRMLLARARAALARDVYPDLLLGLYDPDEAAEAHAVTAPPREELRGEVVPPSKPDTAPATPDAMAGQIVAAFVAEFERVGRAGTLEEAEALMRQVKASTLSKDQRAPLRAKAEAMLSAIRARSPEHSDPEPPPAPKSDPAAFDGFPAGREPGSDDT